MALSEEWGAVFKKHALNWSDLMNILSTAKKSLNKFRNHYRDFKDGSLSIRRMRNLLLNYQGLSDWRNLHVPTIDYQSPDKSDDTHIYQRLITAYHKAISGRDESGDGVWETFSANCHTQLAEYLKQGDCKNVGLILSQMFRDPVTSGLMLGKGTYIATRNDPYSVGLDWHDKAISLGQAVGVVPVQNPEQGTYGTILHLDSLDIFRRSIERLGFAPLPPQVGAMFGIRFAGGCIPVNYLLHLYTAHRLSTISPGKVDSCLEIGGGVGLLAYVVVSMGIKQYCIVDLPLVNVLQGYLLLKSDLADSVQLFGEDEIISESKIKILPSTAVDALPPKSFDLIINQDSLPELSKETMDGYLKVIQRVSKGYFLSINQEARAPTGLNSNQGWVHDACRGEQGMKLIYRAPYWMRKGYVEELYKIIN